MIIDAYSEDQDSSLTTLDRKFENIRIYLQRCTVYVEVSKTPPLPFVLSNYKKTLNLFSYTIQIHISQPVFSLEGRDSNSNDLRIAMADADGRSLHTSFVCCCFGVAVELYGC